MKCIGCFDRPPAPRSKFCTMKCAYLWAENMNESQAWCPVCKEWNEPFYGSIRELDGRTTEHNICLDGHKVTMR